MTQAPPTPEAARRRHDREIVALAVPAFGALVAEPLFVMADSAIVGHLGTAQLAGLGVASALLTTAVSVFVFLAYATTAAVARRVGAGDLRAAIRQGMDGIWLALLLGAAVIAAVLPAAPALVELFGASHTAAPYATTYLRISSLGIPAMLIVLASTGVLRGLQDTKTPSMSPSEASSPTPRSTRALCTAPDWVSPAPPGAPSSPSSVWPRCISSSSSAEPGSTGPHYDLTPPGYEPALRPVRPCSCVRCR